MASLKSQYEHQGYVIYHNLLLKLKGIISTSAPAQEKVKVILQDI
jgi:hypothetical protein